MLLEDRIRSSLVHRMLPHYPALTALAAAGSCCELCLNPFLTTWLECVHFISPKKVQKYTRYNEEMNMWFFVLLNVVFTCVLQDMKMTSVRVVPVRALLCSYKCLNTLGHSYYGIATR